MTGSLFARKTPFSDPGGEVVNAPIGSEAWAQRWRLEMQGIVKNLSYQPERAERYVRQGKELRVWTLLNKRDGSHFRSFEEFCEHPEPWGLGRPYGEILPYLEALHGKRVVQLETAAPDGRRDNRRGGKGPDDSRAQRGNHGTRKQEELRAVLRAPQPIQQLYREGLIGQKVAARLGPDRPTPEDAAVIAEVVEAIRATPRPADPTDVPRVQREVNRRVRDLLGETPDDPVAKVLRLVGRMDDTQRARLRVALSDLLGAEG